MPSRAFLASCFTALLTPSLAVTAPPRLRFTPVAAGLARPVAITSARDGSGRLFVTEQAGRVRILRGGQLLPEPFLDISGRVGCCGERGLLSIAFPPGTSSRFYANYTDQAGDTVVSRFSVGADPDRALEASEEVVLRLPQPFANHNGGQLAFGPDGYLYIGTGDGGSAGDPGNRAQDPAELLGKMLRIAVEGAAAPYAVPTSNPFVGSPGYRPEIWALGLRNPWRFAFDRLTGDLWIADVGQGSWEEINFQPAASPGGENYGWRIREGSHCFDPDPCGTAGLTDPVAEYDHGQGCSVTGGFVYRGVASPTLEGIYFYGDFCSGRIWALAGAGEASRSGLAAATDMRIAAFGEDEQGELYVADYFAGRLVRIDEDIALADLSVALDPGPATLAAPATGVLRASVRNAGPAPVDDARLEIRVPAGVQVSSLDPGRAACALAGGVLYCALPPLGPGDGALVLLGWAAPAAGAFTFTASVASAAADPSPGDNSSASSVTVAAGKARRVRQRLR